MHNISIVITKSLTSSDVVFMEIENNSIKFDVTNAIKFIKSNIAQN